MMTLHLFLELFVFVFINLSQVLAETTGETLVNCAACQIVSTQIDWKCDVNCQVIGGSNGKCGCQLLDCHGKQ